MSRNTSSKHLNLQHLSKKYRRALTLGLCLIASLYSAGCGVDGHLESIDKSSNRVANEMENDREYIRMLAEQLRQLSEAFSLLQKASVTLFENVKTQVSQDVEPDETPSLEDVLKKKQAQEPKEEMETPTP